MGGGGVVLAGETDWDNVNNGARHIGCGVYAGGDGIVGRWCSGAGGW